jgi:hypothetical protein
MREIGVPLTPESVVSRLGSPTVRFGLAAGLLLYAHAWIPNSHAYPFVWPLLGGAAAIWWTARHAAGRLPVGRTARIGAEVGLIAAVVALVLAVPTYVFLTSSAGGPVARALGVPGPLPWSPRALEALALALLVAVPAALLGSAVIRPFARPHAA